MPPPGQGLAPHDPSGPQVDDGLEPGRDLAAPRARRRSTWTSRRCEARWRIASSKISQRARPFSFARYIAVSASRMRDSGSTCSPAAATATPMLAVTTTSRPSMETGASAPRTGGRPPGTPGARRRGGRTPARTRRRRSGRACPRAAAPGQSLGDGHQQIVAGGWPMLSLTHLNRSRSMNTTATVAPAVGERPLQPVEQQGAVGQPGEGVVQRLVGERVLGDLLLGDVLDGADDAQGRAVGRPAASPTLARHCSQRRLPSGRTSRCTTSTGRGRPSSPRTAAGARPLRDRDQLGVRREGAHVLGDVGREQPGDAVHLVRPQHLVGGGAHSQLPR